MTIVTCGVYDKTEIDAAVALPRYVEFDLGDGRKMLIKEWHPHVVVDEIVTVTVEASIEWSD